MRRLLIGLAAIALLTTQGQLAHAQTYLRITSPKDNERFGPGSTLDVSGSFHAASAEQTILLRVRLFAPTKGTFAIVAEEARVLRNANDALSSFAVSIAIPSGNPARRLLVRADCLDLTSTEPYPATLVATSSVFIDIGRGAEAREARSPNNLGRGGPPRDSHNTVTITSPTEEDTYNENSDISVSGNVTGDGASEVKKMRLRFYGNMIVQQEKTVDVTMGGMTSWVFSGTLQAPSGGWFGTNRYNEAQGLDENNEIIAAEVDTVSISLE